MSSRGTSRRNITRSKLSRNVLLAAPKLVRHIELWMGLTSEELINERRTIRCHLLYAESVYDAKLLLDMYVDIRLTIMVKAEMLKRAELRNLTKTPLP